MYNFEVGICVIIIPICLQVSWNKRLIKDDPLSVWIVSGNLCIRKNLSIILITRVFDSRSGTEIVTKYLVRIVRIVRMCLHTIPLYQHGVKGPTVSR